MEKPIKPAIKVFSKSEILDIRTQLRMTRPVFARMFPVSPETVKGWERGTRNMQGPASTILQCLEKYAIYKRAERTELLKNALTRGPKK